MLGLLVMFFLFTIIVEIAPFLVYVWLIVIFLKHKIFFLTVIIVGIVLIYNIECWVLKKLIFCMEQKEKNQDKNNK